VKTNAEEVIRVVMQISLPLSRIVIEDVQMDIARLNNPALLFGYETAAFRKWRGLPKTHIVDALCIATYQTGGRVAEPESNVYTIGFRPRQTRKQYHSLPQKGRGRVRYQLYEELEGFRKGDVVRVKGRFIKQVNAIYGEGRLAFKRVKGEPANAKPQACQLLEREQTIVWAKVS